MTKIVAGIVMKKNIMYIYMEFKSKNHAINIAKLNNSIAKTTTGMEAIVHSTLKTTKLIIETIPVAEYIINKGV